MHAVIPKELLSDPRRPLLGSEASVGGLLRLVGTGAAGPILMALGPRALRTKKLTEQLPSYSPRTLYRHTNRLTELDLINRREIQGVPSTVIHSLSDPSGRQLFHLLRAYSGAEGPVLSHQGDQLWGSLVMLGKMWETGWVEGLSHGGQSVTEMQALPCLPGIPSLTFHQAARRTQQLVGLDLLQQSGTRNQRKRYLMSARARHAMGLIAGVGLWRQRHVLDNGDRGLTVLEMAAVLRSCLPLIKLPEHPDMSIKVGVIVAGGTHGQGGSEILLGHVSGGGAVRCVKDKPQPDAWAMGTINTWFSALLDGERGRMRVGGDLDLVDNCFKRLFEALWAIPLVGAAR